MLEIKLDENEVKKMYLVELEKHISKLDNEVLFWDIKELERQTSLCLNTMKNTFFYNDDFPKKKIRSKWYFPANATKNYLLNWIEQQ
ncbi:group-specific protein [Paraliobacillus sp. X-1268]|uniref:group-specific protein n=1 Tax=Paraliobacillus sp. X-1268 TaxID=2213193 RepID=UPI000E3E1E56|nr:group-specific protein [Paraliobacillus sp. X-1268]